MQASGRSSRRSTTCWRARAQAMRSGLTVDRGHVRAFEREPEGLGAKAATDLQHLALRSLGHESFGLANLVPVVAAHAPANARRALA